MKYAGCFRRSLANILDGVFLGCVFVIAAVVLGALTGGEVLDGSTSILSVAIVAGQLLYFTLCISGPRRTTLFGRLLEIETVTSDGSRLSPDRAFLRTLLHFLATTITSYFMTLDIPAGEMLPQPGDVITFNTYIGVAVFICWHVPCLFTPEKTAWHDIIVGSRVIRS